MAERFGVQGVQFIIQIILARLMLPEHYGSLSIMLIFISIANIFVQTGFNMALIQDKDVTESDYSSVFWVSLMVAIITYIIIFSMSPYIAIFYNMPEIILPLRILALILIPGAFNSIQVAQFTKKMDFRVVFTSNVGAIIFSGIVGIIIALFGGGLWALVVQTMLNTVLSCVAMYSMSRWLPRFICEIKRVKELFSFGWKLLAANLIDMLYQDLSSLVIGHKYSANTLGYYNRGKQFPQFIINAVNSTVQSVMLPAMSAQQDEKEKVKELTRNSIMLSSYMIFPIMLGVAGIASQLVCLLLTDKWIACVPYVQIFCFTLAFYPIHSCNLQAMNALGRSDLFLKLEIIKKICGILTLIVAILYYDSPIAIAVAGAITSFISCLVNALPNKKLINYSYMQQLKDTLPSFFMALLMYTGVLEVGKLELGVFSTLILQIVIGIVLYLFLSIVFKPKPYKMLLYSIKRKKS